MVFLLGKSPKPLVLLLPAPRACVKGCLEKNMLVLERVPVPHIGKSAAAQKERSTEPSEQGPAEEVVRPSGAGTEAMAGFLPIRTALSQGGWRMTSLSASSWGLVRRSKETPPHCPTPRPRPMMGTVSGPTKAGLKAGNGVRMGQWEHRRRLPFGLEGRSQRAHRVPWGSLAFEVVS